MPHHAKVILIGAGPGDPGLLTLRGRDALLGADVVVYDNLVSEEIVALAPPAAERIYVGKMAGKHTMPQEAINELLVREARSGRRVVRLKGGDPFVFGRGAEECVYLRDNGVEFEIVPGVSAAAAVPAYAGIPLTHRELAASFHVITGHEHACKDETSIDWRAVAGLEGTLVIFMGVTTLRSIADALIRHGRSSETPVAAIRWGTVPEQRTLTAPLRSIADEAERAGLRPPGLIVVGEVVRLREQLNWFERRPLFGRVIATPRSRYEESRLSSGLKELGARVVELPLESHDGRAPAPASACGWKDPREYDAVLFASPPSVASFVRELFKHGGDARSLSGAALIAAGSVVEKAMASFGLKPDFMTETLCLPVQVRQLRQAFDLAGKRVLAAGAAPDRLLKSLRGAGARVETLSLEHDSLPPSHDMVAPPRRYDLIAFSCASMVKKLVREISPEALRELAETVPAASVSPAASDELRELGFEVRVQPDEPATAALVDAIAQWAVSETPDGLTAPTPSSAVSS
ncbi:MAG: uroporphyrinogen-III C-methyltransferase [bacterium]|nr:uroporphyrinogen-III C-methyltransferase [bacterium]